MQHYDVIIKYNVKSNPELIINHDKTVVSIYLILPLLLPLCIVIVLGHSALMLCWTLLP